MSTHRLPIESKLLLVSLFIIFGIIVFLFFFYHSFSQSLEKERQVMTKNLSTSAMGTIHHFYDLAEARELTTQEAQALAMDTLKSATYGKNGYFWINDSQGKMLMHPYSPELIGKVLLDMQDIHGKYLFREFIDTSKNGGGWVTYYWPKPHSPEAYPKISYVYHFEPWDWVLGTGVYIDDMHENIYNTIAKGTGLLFIIFIFLVVGTIVTINYYVKQLGYLAIRDSLTNLYTKRFLHEVLPQILEKNKRLEEQLLTVIFFDIDHFKQVNDTHGHNRGDDVLRQVAGVLIQNTRPDDFCIRYGGEEFVLIGFFDDQDSSVKVAERIRTDTAALVFGSDGDKFNITISAGIAFHDAASEAFEATLKRADEKLYESKQNGRNRITV